MKQFLLFISLFISTFLSAQRYVEMMDDYSINFYDVCAEADQYFETIDIHAKGSGYKQYMRWRDSNEHIYFPSGDRMGVDLHIVDKALDTYKSNHKNQFDKNGRAKRASAAWTEVGPNEVTNITQHYAAGIGRVEDFYVVKNNNNKIYLSSRSGGLYKTLNGGDNWTPCATDFLPGTGVNTFSVNPYNSEHVYLNVRNAQNGTSYGVYKSTDGGNTINPTNFVYTNLGLGGLGSNFQIYDVECHPVVRDLIFVATSNGIYKSTNNLATWTRVSNSNMARNIHFHPTRNNVIYTDATSSDRVLISTNTGSSFTTSGSISGNGTTRGYVSVSAQAPRNVYFGSSNGVWVSRNEGASFTRLSSASLGGDAFGVSSVDTNKMVIAGIDSYSTTNHASSFFQSTFWTLGAAEHNASSLLDAYQNSTKYVHADIRKLKSVNGVMYSATDGTLCKSIDDGTTWKDIMKKGVGIRENYKLGASQSEEDVVILGSQDNGTTLRYKGEWVEAYGADGMEGFIHPLNPEWMITSIQLGGRLRSENAAQNWTEADPDGVASGVWQAPILYDPLDHMTIYDFKDNVWKSTDFGKTHAYVGKAGSFTGKINVAEIAHNNTQIMTIASVASIEKSTDGGATFRSIRGSLPYSWIEDIAFDPNNDDVIAVVYASYQNNNQKVYITTNGGSTWQNITYNIGNIPVHTVVIDHTSESNIYIGTETGVYVKPMAANSWTSYSADLPNTTVEELEIVWATNTLKAATWGRGLWEVKLKDRSSFPEIVRTTITNPPTLTSPGEGVSQYVTANINYSGNLSSVYVKASVNGITLDRTIRMTNQGGNTWRSDQPLPSTSLGDKVYFKVYAQGSSNDLTESFRFMYTVQPFEYCVVGASGTGGDYINNVSMTSAMSPAQSNASAKAEYTLFDNIAPFDVVPGETYEFAVALAATFPLDKAAIWIDLNTDAVFSADEKITMGAYTNGVAKGTFTFPTTLVNGQEIRMRVRNSYTGGAVFPCGNVAGEVEDYILKVGGEVTTDPYCTPVVNATGADFITNVNLGDMNNPSGKEGYSYYQNLGTIQLVKGQSYPLTMTLNYSFEADQPAAWIDYNLDGVFSASEAIAMSPFNGGTSSVGNVTVPNNARVGEVLRLRVRNYWSSNAPDPCNAASGEVEDYDVMVQGVVGLENGSEISAFELFPNPARDQITIISRSGQPIGGVSVYDLTGKVVKQYNASGTRVELSTADLPKSIYTVSVYVDGAVENRKLMVE